MPTGISNFLFARPYPGRRIATLALSAGALVVGAVVIQNVVAPSQIKLPENLDRTIQLTGTYTGINETALNQGVMDKIFAKDVPFVITQRVHADQSTADTSVVSVYHQPRIDGWLQGKNRNQYALSRKGFYSIGQAGTSTSVVDSNGLIFTFPTNPVPGNEYRIWDQATSKSYPAVYKGSVKVADRTGLVFSAGGEGPVASPSDLGLPESMTKDQVTKISPELIKTMTPAQVQAMLPAFMAMPNVIPLSYTAKGHIDITVDSELGIPLKMVTNQTITGNVVMGGKTISTPFSHYDVQYSPESAKAVLAEAQDISSKINLVQYVLPAWLAVLGALLALGAVGMVLANAIDRSREEVDLREPRWTGPEYEYDELPAGSGNGHGNGAALEAGQSPRHR